MKTLIIAEKPDMGRTIAAVVEPKASNRRTYLEGDRYIITWAIGHLVSLAEPDQYDPRYKKWRAEDLPIIPDVFKLAPNPRTKEQLKQIGELAKRCDALVNACDAGREGQLIFHLIYQYLKLKQPTQRLWISDLTPETIRKGFDLLRSDEAYAPLTRAARARSEADWLVGMNASRAFTIRHRTLLSVGRVQTPVLALLYDRDREIQAFQSETYYIVEARFVQGEVAYKGIWQGDRLTDGAAATALADKVAGQPGLIRSATRQESKEYPQRLYDLTLLQREANGKYGFPAKKTLDLAQALYEKHKVISYPRTNSNYVTEENLPDMSRALRMLRATSYGELAAGADEARVHKGNKSVCNPAKVEDHHAILPTHKRPGTLSPDEQRIYDLIVRRFLSQYYPPAVYANHEVLTEVTSERFRTRIKQLLDLGWRVVLGEEAVQQGEDKQGEGKSEGKNSGSGRKKNSEQADEEAEQLITGSFSVDPNASVRCASAAAKEKATQPPKAFTEGTLLKAMETAGKSIDDDELKEAMKDSGLGTPATRAATIERLKQVGYVQPAGKRLDITAKGRAAIELIRGAGVELLASPEMTGRWEQRLHQISRTEASDTQFIAKVKQFAAAIVEKVSAQRPAEAKLFQAEAAASVAGGKGKKAVQAGGKGKGEAGGDRKSANVAVPLPAIAGRQALAPCPRPDCSGFLIEGKRGFGCSAYQAGCGFVIWKELSGRQITPAMAKALALKGESSRVAFTLPDGQQRKGKAKLSNRQTGEVTVHWSDH